MENEPQIEKPEETKEPSGKIGRLAVTAIIIVVLVIGGVYFYQKGKSAPTTGSTSTSVSKNRSAKIFDISAKPFEFSVKEIRVKKGDLVRINFAVTEGLHDWVVDEFGARTNQLKTGESGIVEFMADKTGTFEYYCSVGTHRQMGMVGKLIVE